MKLPKKISPCPLLESIVEIRFDPKVPSEAVFGIIYSEIKDLFPRQPEKTPVLQIPEDIRSKDPNLIYQPLYRLKNSNYLVSIGPKVISLSCKRPYSGWVEYSLQIEELIKRVKKTRLIENPLRFGLRYINFFEDNIFDNIKLQMTLDDNSLSSNQNFVRIISQKEPFNIILQISNSTPIKVDGKKLTGSLIDIDVASGSSDIDIDEITSELLNKSHDEEKLLFFKLLKDDFLKTLNPEY